MTWYTTLTNLRRSGDIEISFPDHPWVHSKDFEVQDDDQVAMDISLIIGKGYEYDSIVFDFVENWYEFRYEETEDGPDLIAFTDGTGNDSMEDNWTDSYRLQPNPLDGKLQTLYIKISCVIDDYVEWRVDSQEYRLI